MAKKVNVKKPAAQASSASVSDAWSRAVAREEKAHANAQSGNQLERLEAFRAMVELDKAGAACDAGQAAAPAAEPA